MKNRTNMPTSIMVSLVALIILGLGISSYVISLNFSPKILYSLLSIAGLGVLSIIITTFSILKAEKVSTRFLSTILISSETHLPFKFMYSGTDNFLERQDEIGIISSGLNRDPNYKIDSTNNNSNLCVASLQCQIVKKILDLNLRSSRIQQHNNRLKLTSRDAIVPVSMIECSENSKKELEKIDRYISSPKKILAYFPLYLPKNAEISIDNADSIKYLTIEKKNFFKYQVIIKPLSLSAENTSVYKDLLSEFPEINKYYSVVLEVEIISEFDWLTSENVMTKEYKAWLKYLTFEIEKYFSDSNKH